jgi:hypothetical protein
VFGVWRAIILDGLKAQGGAEGVLISKSKGRVIGEVENL